MMRPDVLGQGFFLNALTDVPVGVDLLVEADGLAFSYEISDIAEKCPIISGG
jgi:hypothetical protein